ncbi:macrophage colony-stimulating factor 1 [Mantella aurantiaca]
MAYLYWTGIFMCLALNVQAKNTCSPPVTDDHLKYLDEMIDAQLNPSCLTEIELLSIKQVKGYCYNRGIISQLSALLERLEFKPNSRSYNQTKILNDLYNQRFLDCIGENEYITQEDLSPCSSHINLSPAEIMERIKMSFKIFRDFEANPIYEKKCHLEYDLCKKESDQLTKGPQCACISPTTPILSGTATQKSLNNLPEIKSTPYASTIPFSTVPLTEYTSGTDSHNPHQSSENIEMSSFILTSIPTEVEHLTTTMDHLHAATTDHLLSESPHIKTDISLSGMEFTKGIIESTNAMHLSQSRTNPGYFTLENLNTDGSHTERLATTSTVLNKDFSQQTEELTSVTEPVVDELLKTTELNMVSQSVVSNFQALETGLESSSSSTVTKMRRSVESADETPKVSTHAQPALTSDDSATKLPYLTLSIPPTLKSLQTMSQESEIKNLGWVASYLFPAMVTTKPASSEAKMSSPGSGVQSLPSEVFLHPKLAEHEGGYTYNNDQQQERNAAAFISMDRENKVVDPIHGFNLLPILETEQHQDGRQKSNLFLVLIPSILAILFLCGLLYFMYRYRLLRRQLNREQAQQLPELRPLAE